MARVFLPSSLSTFADGVTQVDIEATRVVDLLAALGARFPRLAPELDEMAVAVDGEIYQQPGYQPLTAASEVHLVPRIAGG